MSSGWTKGEMARQGDDFRTFLADFVAALPHIDFTGVNVLSTPTLSEGNSRVAWDSPVS
jgi:hypothetical protein